MGEAGKFKFPPQIYLVYFEAKMLLGGFGLLNIELSKSLYSLFDLFWLVARVGTARPPTGRTTILRNIMKLFSYAVFAPLFLGLTVSTAGAEEVSVPSPNESQIRASNLTPVATEAGENLTGAPVVENMLVQQWVKRDQLGNVSGRVVSTKGGKLFPVALADVTLLSPGSKMLTATTNADGQFVMRDAQAGIYAMTARADGFFACCAMHIVDPAMPAAESVAAEVLISAAAIDFTEIQTAVIRYLPATFDPVVRTVQEADLVALKSYIASDETFKIQQRSGGIDGFAVRPGAEKANLSGAEESNVFLFQNGSEVARTMTQPNGHFRFDGIELGDYGLVVVGAAGVGAAGFELVSANERSTVSVRGSDGTVLTQVGTGAGSVQAFQIAPPTETIGTFQGVTISDELISEEVVGEQIVDGQFFGTTDGGFVSGGGGGGFAGGGGGGGGGLGGGGGIGRFAAIGGIAAAIAIAASDDDDNVAPAPQVASPSVPVSGN